MHPVNPCILVHMGCVGVVCRFVNRSIAIPIPAPFHQFGGTVAERRCPFKVGFLARTGSIWRRVVDIHNRRKNVARLAAIDAEGKIPANIASFSTDKIHGQTTCGIGLGRHVNKAVELTIGSLGKQRPKRTVPIVNADCRKGVEHENLPFNPNCFLSLGWTNCNGFCLTFTISICSTSSVGDQTFTFLKQVGLVDGRLGKRRSCAKDSAQPQKQSLQWELIHFFSWA